MKQGELLRIWEADRKTVLFISLHHPLVALVFGIGESSNGALFVVKAIRGAGLPARDIEIPDLANVGLLGSPFATMALK